jgi:hypothetical protein
MPFVEIRQKLEPGRLEISIEVGEVEIPQCGYSNFFRVRAKKKTSCGVSNLILIMSHA